MILPEMSTSVFKIFSAQILIWCVTDEKILFHINGFTELSEAPVRAASLEKGSSWNMLG